MKLVSLVITNSRMKSFNACRRKHQYQYLLGYRPLIDKEAMEFGTIFHAGLEAWWLAHAEGRELLAFEEAQAAIAKAGANAFSFDEASAAKADLLMLGYHARWSSAMADYEVIGVEWKFEAPLPTPAGAKRARGLKVAGKLDVLVRKLSDGTIWIVEHKVTQADLTPGSTYWQRLRMDTQISVYFEGAGLQGYPPTGCLYDVISKPTQRPHKATPIELRKYTKEKRGKDGSLIEASRLYATQRAEDETMDEFKARMAQEIAGAPEAYFQRSEVVRLESELEESRRDTYDTAMMIREAKNADRAPRNPDACHLYGSVCPYFDVCAGGVALDDETRFKRLGENVHPELAQ